MAVKVGVQWELSKQLVRKQGYSTLKKRIRKS